MKVVLTHALREQLYQEAERVAGAEEAKDWSVAKPVPVVVVDQVLATLSRTNYLGFVTEGGDEALERLARDVEAEAHAVPPSRVRPDGPETAEGGLIGQEPY